MTPEAHLAALRAAARVAFSVALLSGCSSAASEETTAANDSNLDKAKSDNTNTDETAPDDGCKAILEATFPSDATQPWPQALSHEAALCCREAIAHPWSGPLGGEAYKCCGRVDETDPDAGKIWSQPACSPWGPPVPPSMQRTLKRAPLLVA